MPPIDKENFPGLHRLLDELKGKYETLLNIAWAGDNKNAELLAVVREQIDELTYKLRRTDDRVEVDRLTIAIGIAINGIFLATILYLIFRT